MVPQEKALGAAEPRGIQNRGGIPPEIEHRDRFMALSGP
jgi:hypothetical protein